MKYVCYVVAFGAIATFSTANAAGQVALAVSLSPAGSFTAKSSTIHASLDRTPEGSWSSGEIAFDLTTLKTGIELRDSHMLNKYFETTKFPKAVLSNAAGKNGEFTGDLTIRGTSKKVSGQYQWEAGELKATFRCKLSDFNMPEANYMGVGVEDEVEVAVSLATSGQK